MFSKTNNSCHIEGYVFSTDRLAQRVSKKTNTPFINGTVNVATDDKGLNVVPVFFRYVTETFKSGKPNPAWEILTALIDHEGSDTFEVVGTSALKVRIDGSVGTNDFVSRDGEVVSPKRVEGQFMHVMTNEISENPATFDVDMLIANAAEREVEDGDDFVNLRGYVFDYRGGILPVDVNVRSKGGMDYFIDQDISNKNPLLTHIKGSIVSQAITTEKTEESAFGDPVVHKVVRHVRSWDVTWAAVEPYEWDDESTITKKEFKQKLNEREERMAEVKRNHDEYQANRNGGQNFAAVKESPKPAPKTEVQIDTDEDDDEDWPF